MSYNLLSILPSDKALSGGEVGYVCLMGIGIVFAGLVCIVIICTIMSAIMKRTAKEAPTADVKPVQATPTVSNVQIANKQEFVAAVSAAIAEESGTDISAIRIKSIKRI